MIGKPRVAPTKRMTIPDLELQAAGYAAQLSKFIQDQLDITIRETHF